MKEGNFIASGAEKNVFEHPRDPKKIIKRYKYEEQDFRSENFNKIKARYYFGKLLHILYPKNFPDMHVSGSRPEQLVMEKKNLDPEHREIHEMERRLRSEDRKLSREENERIKTILESRRQDPEVRQLRTDFSERDIHLDKGAINYAYDENGNVVFVDNVHPWAYTYSDIHPIVPNFDVKKLEVAVAELENDEDKKIAAACLKRLEELYMDEKKKVEEKREERIGD